MGGKDGHEGEVGDDPRADGHAETGGEDIAAVRGLDVGACGAAAHDEIIDIRGGGLEGHGFLAYYHAEQTLGTVIVARPKVQGQAGKTRAGVNGGGTWRAIALVQSQMLVAAESHPDGGGSHWPEASAAAPPSVRAGAPGTGEGALNALVVFTTALGFVVGSKLNHFPITGVYPAGFNWTRLWWTCVGTFLAAVGASAFNQALEARQSADDAPPVGGLCVGGS